MRLRLRSFRKSPANRDTATARLEDLILLLFDEDWYLEHYPEVTNLGLSPLQHFLKRGWKEGLKPSPLFDTRWYSENYPEVARAATNPLVDYVRDGWKQSRNPHPLFDSNFYLEWNPGVRAANVPPLVHYLTRGGFDGRDPHPLFDTSYYFEQRPELSRANIVPLQHYVTVGIALGLDPHPLFDTRFYWEQNPKAQGAGMTALEHYLRVGASRNRDPHPSFDTSFYAERYPDARNSGINPLIHYVTIGSREGRVPHRWAEKRYPTVLPAICGKQEWDERGENRLRAFFNEKRNLTFPKVDDPQVSVLLVLRNRANLSLLCLESILANASSDFEVVIVDNASNDSTLALLDRCRHATIIRNSENLGFGPACMQAARVARGRFLLFLNNDTLLEPGAILSGIRDFEDKTVGAVGGKILLADGALQEAGVVVWSNGLTYQYGRGDVAYQPQYDFRRLVDYCSGAFLMTPRKLFFELGGFDPIYGIGYYEDVDYCMKIWQAGLNVLYEPESVIRHFENATSGGAESSETLGLISRNRAFFNQRWKDQLKSHCPESSSFIRARIASQSKPLRLLFLEDRVPHRHFGPVYARTNCILLGLDSLGIQVSCAAMTAGFVDSSSEYTDIPRSVELVDVPSDHRRFYYDYVPNFDVVWIRGARQFERFCEDLLKYGVRPITILFDADEITGWGSSKLAAALRIRRAALMDSADLVVLNSGESAINGLVLPPFRDCSEGPAFLYRKNFLLPVFTANEERDVQAVRDFCTGIWPQIHHNTRAELIVSMLCNQHWSDREMDGVRIVTSLDQQMLEQTRVILAPLAYLPSLSPELHRSVDYGLPTVAWLDIDTQAGTGRSNMLATLDGDQFVQTCCELYSDEALWNRLRSFDGEQISTKDFRKALLEIVNRVITVRNGKIAPKAPNC